MRKVFVSYKYKDCQVYQDHQFLSPVQVGEYFESITPRSYLNALEVILKDYAIQKWEKDDEDLSQFQDETIASKLRDKIFDSSLTMVLISPGMRDSNDESDQWIPWEVAYSLRESSREGRKSKTNAMLAVVLPDVNNSYDYCIEKQDCGANILKFSSSFCFPIIGGNFFNKKNPDRHRCDGCGEYHWYGADNHYFAYATWSDFLNHMQYYMDIAYRHSENTDKYDIRKKI